jgi:putative FmdB family regulatory protein
MPTYEFRCPDGHVFDKFFRSISAAEMEVPCPTCGKVAARQISGGAGLQFKGSGFYLTDYGKNAHRGGAAPAKGGASSDGKSGGDAAPSGGGNAGAEGGSSSTPAPSGGEKSSTGAPSGGSKGGTGGSGTSGGSGGAAGTSSGGTA